MSAVFSKEARPPGWDRIPRDPTSEQSLHDEVAGVGPQSWKLNPDKVLATYLAMLKLPRVRAGIVEVSHLKELKQLRHCSSDWRAEVDLHLFREEQHLVFRPTSEGVSYIFATKTVKGIRDLHLVNWYEDDSPPGWVKGSRRVITLPAFRAGAVLRHLNGCPSTLEDAYIVGGFAQIDDDDDNAANGANGGGAGANPGVQGAAPNAQGNGQVAAANNPAGAPNVLATAAPNPTAAANPTPNTPVAPLGSASVPVANAPTGATAAADPQPDDAEPSVWVDQPERERPPEPEDPTPPGHPKRWDYEVSKTPVASARSRDKPEAPVEDVDDAEDEEGTEAEVPAEVEAAVAGGEAATVAVGGEEDTAADAGAADEWEEEEEPGPSSYELAIEQNYDFPAGVLSGTEILRLDCKPRWLGGSDQEIAGRMPDDVRTVVLRTAPQLDFRSTRKQVFKALHRTTMARTIVRLPSEEDEEFLCALAAEHNGNAEHALRGLAEQTGGDAGNAFDALAEEMHVPDDAEKDALRALAKEYRRFAEKKVPDTTLAYHIPVISGQFGTLVVHLAEMHEDAILSLELVRAPLRRIVIVCGSEYWGGWKEREEGAAEAGQDVTPQAKDWEEPDKRRWGVLQQIMETYGEQKVTIDVVDAHRAGRKLGCDFQSLWRTWDVLADIRYLDSELDVGPMKRISPKEWKLFTRF